MSNVRDVQASADPKQALAEAETALSRAEEALQNEQRRLQLAQEEITTLTDQVRTTDPDDRKAFARLVQARDAACGREEALTVRVEAAAQERAKLEKEAQEARRVAIRADLEADQARLKADGDAITALVKKRTAELVARLGEHRTLAGGVGDLARRLEEAEGRGNSLVPPQIPSTGWSGLPTGDLATALIAVGEQLGRILAWERGAAARKAHEESERRQLAARATREAAEAEVERERAARRTTMVEGLEVTTRLAGEHLSQTVRVPADYDPTKVRLPGDFDPLAADRRS